MSSNNRNNVFSPNRLKQRANQSGGSDSILSALFAMILQETNVGFQRWNDSMTRYIKDPRNSIPSNNREQSSERGNLNKELLHKSKMTWKVFCKGMRLIGYIKFDLIIKIHHVKHVSVHSKTIILGPQSEEDDSEGIELPNALNVGEQPEASEQEMEKSEHESTK
jgi:hypothetical protein